MAGEVKYFYSISDEKPIFTVFGQPDPKVFPSKKCVVVCQPFFDEKLYAYRIIEEFFILLRQHGFHTCKFDYFGDGDSYGEFQQFNISSCVTNLKDIESLLRKKYEIEDIILFGVRAGSAIITEYIKKYKDIEKFLFWAPVFNLNDYLFNTLRRVLTFQMATFRKILYDRKQMIEILKNGGTINYNGYIISSKLFLEMDSIQNFEVNFPQNSRVAFLDFQKNLNNKNNELIKIIEKIKNRDINVYSQIIQEVSFWEEMKFHKHFIPEAHDFSIKWIMQNA